MNNLQKIYDEANKHYISGSCAGGRYNATMGQPLYIEKAHGCRFWDADGKEYIDYHTGAGASMYGYDHPRLKTAVEKALSLGFFMNFDTNYHAELGAKFKEIFPSAEKLRLCNSGTESTLGAIRIARRYTGKELVIKMEGHFHGMHEMVWFNHNNVFGTPENGEVASVDDSAGFPASAKNLVKNVLFNDIGALTTAVEKYKNQVACIILEPISFNCGCYPARKEYLQQVRALCDQEGIVLIFDEVITGLRMRPGSAQKYYGVTPDITTAGKAIGGGFPMAAIAGKEKIMNVLGPVGDVVISGTYSGALIPVLASLECFKMCLEPGFYDHIDHIANLLYRGMDELFKKHKVPGHVRGHGARFGIYFGVENPEDDYDFRKVAKSYDRKIYGKFIKEGYENGLFFHDTSGAVNPAHYGFTSQHTAKDIEITLDKIDKIFANIK